MAIPRGGTPTHIFDLPFDTTDIVKGARITYAQNDIQILCKETEDCKITENAIITELTQDETFLFDDDIPVQIQLEILDFNNKVHPSDIITKSAKKLLNKEVFE